MGTGAVGGEGLAGSAGVGVGFTAEAIVDVPGCSAEP